MAEQMYDNGVVMDAVRSSILPEDKWNPLTPPHFDERTRAYHVYSYPDVSRVLSDEEVFCNETLPQEVKEQAGLHVFDGCWGMRNPEHDDARRIIAPHLRLKVVRERLAAITQAETDRAIDEIVAAGSGRFDYMTLGGVPVRVITGYLGMDPDDQEVSKWLRDFNANRSTPPQEESVHEKFLAHLEATKETFPEGRLPVNPAEAVVAALRAEKRIGDKKLTASVAAAQLQMLRSAGDETTRMGIANILQGASDHKKLKYLAANPALVPAATEEAIGRYPSFPAAWRRTTQEVTVAHGFRIPAGELVMAWISAANYQRDPNLFGGDPYTFTIGREPNKHLSWGVGYANCAGVHLARLIINEVVGAAVTRLPELAWDGRDAKRNQSIVPSVEEGQLGFVFNAEKAAELAAAR